MDDFQIIGDDGPVIDLDMGDRPSFDVDAATTMDDTSKSVIGLDLLKRSTVQGQHGGFAPPPVEINMKDMREIGNGGDSGSGGGGFFSRIFGGGGSGSGSSQQPQQQQQASSGGDAYPPPSPRFGGMSSSVPSGQTVYRDAAPQMSQADIRKKKREILTKFSILEQRGIQLEQRFDMNSNLEDMEGELERIVNERQMINAVKKQRNLLVMLVNGLEFLNNKYDPFGAQLDGWGETLREDLDNYDDIFMELYEKYKDKSKFAPEVRLIFSIIMSGVGFHMTQSMMKAVLPGLESVVRDNPAYGKAAMEAIGSKMREDSQLGGLGEMMMKFMSGGSGAPTTSPPPAAAPPRMAAPVAGRREMRGPSTNYDELLGNLNVLSQQQQTRDMAPPPTADMYETRSVISDHRSVVSGVGGRGVRRRGAGSPRVTMDLDD